MNCILITGAAGKIGSTLREGLRGRYAVLRLSDLAPLDPARAGEEIVRADLADLAEVEAAMRGVDCVVHLGAIPGEDTSGQDPAQQRGRNLECVRGGAATRCASRHLCKLASRGRVLSARPLIDQMVIRRPDGHYGVSKVFGEAAGRLFADKHGLAVACLRIGAFRDKPADRRLLRVWLSPRDVVQLVGCCIEAPDYHFIVVYGVSDNTRNRYRNAGSSSSAIGRRTKQRIMRPTSCAPRTPRMRSRGNSTAAPIREMGFDGDLARIE